MSKWCPTTRFTLAYSALILIIFFFIPNLSQAAQVILRWDPNIPAPDGYCIYYRTESQAFDYSKSCWRGSGTTGTVKNLADNTTYYFIVRAYAGKIESADSNGVKFINRTSSSTPQPDGDKDGIVDTQDAFPLDGKEWIDSDGDGVGNNIDTDDDNDGMLDGWEASYGLNPLIKGLNHYLW